MIKACPQTENPQTVAVLGLGYVGCVTAACLAHLGHTVIGVDKDAYKVDSVQKGQAPFYEPGLEDWVKETVQAGRLSATTSTADGIRNADIALLCVGTPSEKNGNLGLDQLRRVVADISEHLEGRTKPLIVAVRSTVFPGTCEEVVMPQFAGNRSIAVVSNPEFLREGVAMRDFVEPSLVVVGGDDPAPVRRVADLYSSLGIAPCLVSLRTAEMIKYACNAFHAVKISFANEIGALASQLGVDGEEVMKTLCQDVRLNIAPTYLRPGFAFGGSCLPKDLRALVYRANRMDITLPLLESALPSNREHLHRSTEEILALAAARIGVIGLAFKENTDDLRESPVITLLEQLIGKGKNVRVFDPHIRLDEIYGANRNFILNAIPHIGRLMDSQIEKLLQWADYLVLTQKQTGEIARAIENSGLPVLDLTRPNIRTAANVTAMVR